MALGENSAIINNLRSGLEGDEYIQFSNVQYKVINGKVVLNEIPDKVQKVQVVDPETNQNYFEKFNDIPQDGEYLVDYAQGIVTLPQSAEGKFLSFSFAGRGIAFSHVDRIYTQQENGQVVETLGGIIQAGRDGIENINTLNTLVGDTQAATADVLIAKDQMVQDTQSSISDLNAHRDSFVYIPEEYSAAKHYKINNQVTYNGYTYICIQDTIGNVPSETSSYWRVFAAGKDSILRKKVFTATEGQTDFDVSDVGQYPIGANKINILVGGVPQASGLSFTEVSPTLFRLASGVSAGTVVVATWFDGTIGTASGHNLQHKKGGGDEIAAKELRGAIHGANLVDYGGDLTGVADSSSALIASLNDPSDTVFIPKGTYFINQNVTIPSNEKLLFDRNARFKIASGKTLTINGVVDANPNENIYDLSLGGSVISSPKSKEIYPQWFGATGIGTVGTTDTGAFLKCIESAIPNKNKILIPSGTYYISSPLDIQKGVHIEGIGQVELITSSTYAFDHMIRVYQNEDYSNDIPLVASASKGDNSVTISSSFSVAVDSYIKLISNALFKSIETLKKQGEILRVRDVTNNGDGTQTIGFYSRIHANYLTTDSAKIRKMTLNDGVVIKNLKLSNKTPNTGTKRAIQIIGATNVNIESVHVDGFDNEGLLLVDTVSAFISKFRATNLTNDQTTGKYGYGISVARASQSVIIEKCHFRRTRHGVTIDGQDGEWGVPRHIVVANCMVSEGSQANFDTHPVGEFITFTNCQAMGQRLNADPYGNVYINTIGFQIRSNSTKVIGCTSENHDEGMWIDRYATNVDIEHNSFTNLKSGILVRPDTGTGQNGHCNNIRIHGNTFRMMKEYAVSISTTNDNVLVDSNLIDGHATVTTGLAALYTDSNNVLFVGNTIRDTLGLSLSGKGIQFGDNARNGNAQRNIIKDITGQQYYNTGGTSNSVVTHFNEMDADTVTARNATIDTITASTRLKAQFLEMTNSRAKLIHGVNGSNVATDVFWFMVNGEVSTTDSVFGAVRDSAGKRLIVKEFVHMGGVTSLPTASAANVGWVAYLPGGAGVADAYFMCLKSSAGTYSWKQIISG